MNKLSQRQKIYIKNLKKQKGPSYEDKVLWGKNNFTADDISEDDWEKLEQMEDSHGLVDGVEEFIDKLNSLEQDYG